VPFKRAILKSKFGPWLDEAYVLSATTGEKLANLQTTKQKIHADSAGPSMKQLVDQVKQAATQYIAEVAAELGGRLNKISTPAE